MIGKVTRGTGVARLLRYLYGPGKANEHTDPHLVAGFGDPAELEPERRPDGAPDLRRLAGLLVQPLAALNGGNYDKPVWHCSLRAAPGDHLLSDAEWAQVAARVMHRTGLACEGDDLAVRWVAVRHAADHIHLVVTLARQDQVRPKVWNDFLRVREGCQEAERWFSLRSTAPADRTAARRSTRAETEQAARRGWSEAPRIRLRREVCTAAAGARTEQEFFTRLTQAGVRIRCRYSTVHPGEVTGYAVNLSHHTDRDGQPIWYGGGKLAADLTLPKLRARWDDPHLCGPLTGVEHLSPQAVRAVLRTTVTEAAHQATGEAEFFAVGAPATSGCVGAQCPMLVGPSTGVRRGAAELVGVWQHCQCWRWSWHGEYEVVVGQVVLVGVCLEFGGDLAGQLDPAVLPVLWVVLDEEAAAPRVELRVHLDHSPADREPTSRP
jgi:hypothetical protein